MEDQFFRYEALMISHPSFVCLCITVFCVAENRSAKVGEMSTDLVRFSGMEDNSHKRQTAFYLNRVEFRDDL